MYIESGSGKCKEKFVFAFAPLLNIGYRFNQIRLLFIDYNVEERKALTRDVRILTNLNNNLPSRSDVLVKHKHKEKQETQFDANRSISRKVYRM